MTYRWWLAVAAGLFVIGLVTGLVMPVSVVGILADELAALGEFGGTLTPFTVSTALFIFFKNVSALLVSFVFSPLLCVVPALTLLLNGGVLAVVAAEVARKIPVGLVIAALLPHGMFELPAIIIAEAAALNFGVMAMIAIVSRQRRQRFPAAMRLSLKYLAVACILLVPAALIETFVTPLLLR